MVVFRKENVMTRFPFFFLDSILTYVTFYYCIGYVKVWLVLILKYNETDKRRWLELCLVTFVSRSEGNVRRIASWFITITCSIPVIICFNFGS